MRIARGFVHRIDESTITANIDRGDRLAGGRNVVREVFGGHAFFFEVIDDDHRPNIRIHRRPRQEAARHAQIRRHLTAAIGMRDRHGAVNRVGDSLHHPVGIYRSGQDQQVIAYPDIAVRAQVSHKF